MVADWVVDSPLPAESGLRFGQDAEAHRSAFPVHHHHLWRVRQPLPLLADDRQGVFRIGLSGGAGLHVRRSGRLAAAPAVAGFFGHCHRNGSAEHGHRRVHPASDSGPARCRHQHGHSSHGGHHDSGAAFVALDRPESGAAPTGYLLAAAQSQVPRCQRGMRRNQRQISPSRRDEGKSQE